jgi:hypothetical protein
MDDQVRLGNTSDRFGETVEAMGPEGTAGVAVAGTWIILAAWFYGLNLLGYAAGQRYVVDLVADGDWVQRAAIALLALGVSVCAASLGYLVYRKAVARRVRDRLDSAERRAARNKRVSADTHRFYPSNSSSQ